MWRERVRQVMELVTRDGGTPEPPCTPAELAVLQEEVRDAYGAELPGEYLEFLSMANGLAYNGTFLNASRFIEAAQGENRVTFEGIVSATDEFREHSGEEAYIILGQDSLACYALNTETGKFVEIMGLEEVREQPTCGHLIDSALRHGLGIAGEGEDDEPAEDSDDAE